MSDLADLVPSLRRAVAPPGRFEELFPDATEADLVGQLLDGMAEAQLDGFLHTYDADDDGITVPDLTRPQGALVVLWASYRLLFAEIRNRKTHVRYEAKGAVFEEDQTATLLVQLLKDMKAAKDDLKEQARLGNISRAFYMADQYFERAVGNATVGLGADRAYDYNANTALRF